MDMAVIEQMLANMAANGKKLWELRWMSLYVSEGDEVECSYGDTVSWFFIVSSQMIYMLHLKLPLCRLNRLRGEMCKIRSRLLIKRTIKYCNHRQLLDVFEWALCL